MAYNVLAGGMLTGKYLDSPAAPDEPNPLQSLARTTSPRGRMDDISWGHLALGVCRPQKYQKHWWMVIIPWSKF